MLPFTSYKKSRKGALEFEELGRLILMAVFLIVLLSIVGFLLRDKLQDQVDKIGNVFSGFLSIAPLDIPQCLLAPLIPLKKIYGRFRK